jgi:hypothetical protein
MILNPNRLFLKGCNLVDGVIIINEVVDLAKRRKHECLIL